MKNNNIKQIFNESQVTDEIKKLMETEQLCCDEHDNFDGELLNKIIELCESSGRINPKCTVTILEELLLNSDFLPNAYFMDRYANCLTCSCNDQDEDYIQTAIHKLRLIIENIEDINLALFINKYIECTSVLIRTQESEQAEQTILELKHFCDKTNAWENPDSISGYKSALYDLHEIQCHAGDTQGAVESLEEIISIVNTYDDM